MAWSTPKTDWHGAVDSNGNYVGDWFNAVDFNRIKNNLAYLSELANILYKEFATYPMGNDRTASDYVYADEINQLEANLASINTHSLNLDYGYAPFYIENGHTMDYAELNRIEGAMADLHEKLSNQSKGRKELMFNLGFKGGEL